MHQSSTCRKEKSSKMSFRIDDILKDNECEKVRRDVEEKMRCDERILQRILTNEYNAYQRMDRLRSYYSPTYYEKDCFRYSLCQSERGHMSPGAYLPHTFSTFFPKTSPYIYSLYNKRKGGQVRFTALQTDALENRFKCHKYLSPEDRKKLADNLSLSDRQVKTWFQNRRAKWRRSNSISSTCERIPNIDREDESERECPPSSTNK